LFLRLKGAENENASLFFVGEIRKEEEMKKGKKETS
jgi:hypothetical protein